jgi:ribosomal protein L34E
MVVAMRVVVVVKNAVGNADHDLVSGARTHPVTCHKGTHSADQTQRPYKGETSQAVYNRTLNREYE